MGEEEALTSAERAGSRSRMTIEPVAAANETSGSMMTEESFHSHLQGAPGERR